MKESKQHSQLLDNRERGVALAVRDTLEMAAKLCDKESLTGFEHTERLAKKLAAAIRALAPAEVIRAGEERDAAMLRAVRELIIFDRTTGAADYAEAETYADNVLRGAGYSPSGETLAKEDGQGSSERGGTAVSTGSGSSGEARQIDQEAHGPCASCFAAGYHYTGGDLERMADEIRDRQAVHDAAIRDGARLEEANRWFFMMDEKRCVENIEDCQQCTRLGELEAAEKRSASVKPVAPKSEV